VTGAMPELIYFAYGSNMSSRRLRQRVPSARVVGRGVLPGYRLAWHQRGRDGSGKCDIAAGGGRDVVHGVVYAFRPEHKPWLDRAEGLGHSYAQRTVRAWLVERGGWLEALTYYALRTGAGRTPFAWYRDHVLIGAREHGLPGPYIRMLEAVAAQPDPDPGRERAERRVHEAPAGD